ncbi:hypothetical protein [Enterococcus sp. AZ109]|uniref:hypothetical protein n=1 Tax=Enterococcus sp. AZ109 TaxID=2774634 RepID=UPI003F21222D
MMDLLRADWFKARRSRMLYMLFLLACFSSGVMFFMAYYAGKTEDSSGVINLASFFSDPQMVSLLGCVLAGIYVCRDFEEKVMEQAIASRKRRGEIVLEKAIILLLFVNLLYVPYVLGSLVLTTTSIDFSAYLPTVLLQLPAENQSLAVDSQTITGIIKLLSLTVFTMAAQLMIALPLVFLLKRPASVLAASYGILLLLGPIALLNETTQKLLSYTPYSKDLDQMTLAISNHYFFQRLAINFVFILVMILISYGLFRKKEVR